MLSPTEVAPASWAPRLAASISPGPPPVITANPASPIARADLARAGVERVARGRAGRAEDADRGPEVGERLEALAQLLLDQREALLVGAGRGHGGLLGADDLLAEGGGRDGSWSAHCTVSFASGGPTTFESPHGSIRKTTAAPRRERRRRHRAGARRPARDRARSTVDDARAARLVRERQPTAGAAPETVRKAIEIGSPGARQRGDRGQRRLRAPRARAGPRRARPQARRHPRARAPRRSPSGSPPPSAPSATTRSRRRSRRSSAPRRRQHREELLRTLTAEDGSNPLVAMQAADRQARCSRPRSATGPRSSGCASRTRRRRGRCSGRSPSCQGDLARLLERERRRRARRRGRGGRDPQGGHVRGARARRDRGDRRLARRPRHAHRGRAGRGRRQEGRHAGRDRRLRRRLAGPDRVRGQGQAAVARTKAWAELNEAMAARAASFAVLVVAGEDNVPVRARAR